MVRPPWLVSPRCVPSTLLPAPSGLLWTLPGSTGCPLRSYRAGAAEQWVWEPVLVLMPKALDTNCPPWGNHRGQDGASSDLDAEQVSSMLQHWMSYRLCGGVDWD